MREEKILLADMKTGEKGEIANFFGGARLRKKLNSLGLRRGKQIKIISNMAFDGPVTVDTGYTRIAVGRGMAEKVLIVRSNFK